MIAGLLVTTLLLGLVEFASGRPLRLLRAAAVCYACARLRNTLDGKHFLKVERAHPDRSGHEIIATDIARELRSFASFATFAGPPTQTEGRGKSATLQ